MIPHDSTTEQKVLWQMERQTDYLHKIRGLLIGILIVLIIPIVLTLLALVAPQ
jgi:hypothetical protein